MDADDELVDDADDGSADDDPDAAAVAADEDMLDRMEVDWDDRSGPNAVDDDGLPLGQLPPGEADDEHDEPED